MTEEEKKKLVDDEVAKQTAAIAAKNAELLAEKKKLADEKKALEDAKALSEANALKEKNDWKSLAEKYENEAKAQKDALEAAKKNRESEIKKGAFSLELDKLGIIPERKAFILGSVNVDGLQYVEAGNVVLGADIKAKEILGQMPEIFGKSNNKLPPNQGGGVGAPAHMSDEWYSSLSSADKTKHYAEYMASKGITVKK